MWQWERCSGIGRDAVGSRDVWVAGMLHLAGDVHPTKIKMGKKKFPRRTGRIRSLRRALIPLGGRL